MEKIHVLVWSELTEPKDIYPNGINGAIASYLSKFSDLKVKTSQFPDPEQGLSRDLLQWCDVLIWFGHAKHKDVSDENVERIVERVWDGMGFIPLHSSHLSRPLISLLGRTCRIGSWDEDGMPEKLYVIEDHPITEGVENFILPHTETYGEPFDVPPPESILFISIFHDGTIFKSGVTWRRKKGRIFYFRPGHETYPIFYEEKVLEIIRRGVYWASFSL
ncbi:trehalose utilization protein ThuA [Candidatus Bathyarchaeota archaeon ex4484_205]|nr:MAG: trehalose utilization protein ThuA [Candidatus Bathyarchaeota archaeon ex4484_205]RLF79725.1 MAG: trehalose utilization protein ThuA [Thermococci archaeon]